MSSLAFVFCIFLTACSLHVFIHRILYFLNRKSLVSLIIFAAGFLFIPETPFQFSSRILYGLLSLLASLFYLTPYLGGETPASMILDALHTKKRMTEKDILDLFSDYGLIHKRVEDLVQSGLLMREGKILFLSSVGNFSVRAIVLYQKIFNRVLTG